MSALSCRFPPAGSAAGSAARGLPRSPGLLPAPLPGFTTHLPGVRASQGRPTGSSGRSPHQGSGRSRGDGDIDRSTISGERDERIQLMRAAFRSPRALGKAVALIHAHQTLTQRKCAITPPHTRSRDLGRMDHNASQRITADHSLAAPFLKRHDALLTQPTARARDPRQVICRSRRRHRRRSLP